MEHFCIINYSETRLSFNLINDDNSFQIISIRANYEWGILDIALTVVEKK